MKKVGIPDLGALVTRIKNGLRDVTELERMDCMRALVREGPLGTATAGGLKQQLEASRRSDTKSAFPYVHAFKVPVKHDGSRAEASIPRHRDLVRWVGGPDFNQAQAPFENLVVATVRERNLPFVVKRATTSVQGDFLHGWVELAPPTELDHAGRALLEKGKLQDSPAPPWSDKASSSIFRYRLEGGTELLGRSDDCSTAYFLHRDGKCQKLSLSRETSLDLARHAATIRSTFAAQTKPWSIDTSKDLVEV